MKRDFSTFNWVIDKKKEPYEVFLESFSHNNFVWLDSYGFPNNITLMETNHIFYTMRMIWNHICSKDLIIDHKKEYDFSEEPIYCDAYFKKGLTEMLKELSTRKDIKKYLEPKIEFMKKNINNVV